MTKPHHLISKKIIFQLGITYLATSSAFGIAFLIFNHNQMERLAHSYTQASRHSLITNDFRQAVSSLAPATSNGFTNVEIINSNGSAVLVAPNSFLIENRKHVFNWQIEVPIFSDFENPKKIASTKFTYSIYHAISIVVSGCIVLFFLFGLLFLQLRKRFLERADFLDQQKKMELEKAISAQVAHDIRSPLSALNMMLGTLNGIPEENRLIIRNATQRINDIANGLLSQSKAHKVSDNIHNRPTNLHSSMLVTLLDSIVSEKRIQFRENMDVEIQGELNHGYGLFAKINATEFSRVVSNLINNSVESFGQKGKVTVSIRGNNSFITVSIRDNGKGIPKEVLSKLGTRGLSHEKDGTGLGIHHARETIENLGGQLQIESEVGVGTSITITIPRSETPKWFVEKITLTKGSTVISADDDQTIHQIWRGRLAPKSNANITHLTFSSLDSLDQWLAANPNNKAKFLFDYEFLGQNSNGLDFIEKAKLADRSILVTSRYEETSVREKAEKLGVKILPKGLAPFVPIEIEESKMKFDYILIDDDKLIHRTWTLAAKHVKVDLLCFADPEDFFHQAEEFDLNTPLYIDVNLSNEVKGQDIARKAHSLGFTNINLATGYSPDVIEKPDFIKSVIGKEPPYFR